MLQLWNTLHRELEVFKPVKPGKVGLYTCGPTVYSSLTLGNWRAFVFDDVLKRTLRFSGYEVTHVLNITDVGHLTGDVDEGEDKVQKAALKQGKTAWDVARLYEAEFREGMKKLNIDTDAEDKRVIMPRATDHIQEQIEVIQALEKNGYTYQIADGIYFDTQKFEDYGKLSGQRLDEKEAGARVEVNTEKHHPVDFALWKFSPKDQTRQMEWPSPWGVGFPGWHIECSAMAKKYLGQPFDIHCGGVDHIPVHHENEIAQSEAAFGVPLAHYWLHNEFLLIDGGRMGKSLGNAYTLEDVQAKGFEALDFRYLCLGAHYRSKLNFTWESLEGAHNALEKLRRRFVELGAGEGGVHEGIMQEFKEVLEKDLGTAQGLALMWDVLSRSEIDPGVKRATLLAMDEVFGLGMKAWQVSSYDVPEEIAVLQRQRDEARRNKDWVTSDQLRDALKSQGWLVEDGDGRSTVRKI